MKISQKGFVITPTLLAIIALLVISGGTYVYKQINKSNQLVVNNETNQVTPMSQRLDFQEDGIRKIRYDQATLEQKSFLDRVVKESAGWFKKDKVFLLYFNVIKNVAVVGGSSADSANSEEYSRNHVVVGFFHPLNFGEIGSLEPFQEGGLFFAKCSNAASFLSSCSYVTDKYLVLIRTEDGGDMLVYKAGNLFYDKKLLMDSSAYSLGGSYVKEYNTNKEPILETSFDGKKITASLYKDNQYIGMGYFDLTKKNEKLRTVTFDLDLYGN